VAGAITRIRELEGEGAITVGDRPLTYGQLRRAAGALVAELAGVGRAGVWADSTLEAAVALVALVEAGIEAVPINPKLGSAELQHILSDARPEVVIGGPDGVGVDLDASGELPAPPTDPEAVTLIVYTSGTTGPPKGVLMPRRAITTNLDALASAWAWTARDSVTHALPIFHVHGLVLGLLGPLRRGGHVHHLGQFSPPAVADALDQGDTMLFGVPTMYHRLADAASGDARIAAALGRARLLVSGSAPLPARTFNAIRAATGQLVVERYGLTETIMNTAVRADGERRPGEVGGNVDGVDLRLLTDDGGEAPWDGETIGEVVVRGPNLFLGYLNRPDATAAAMRDGWFWTGDLATRAPDGYLRIVGRRSTDLIKTGGYRVGAGEVEAALLEHPAVSEVAVRGEPDQDLGERISAWVVLRDGAGTPDARELSEHVAALLAPHKRPRRISYVSELPRNAMGKVIKQRLSTPPAEPEPGARSPA